MLILKYFPMTSLELSNVLNFATILVLRVSASFSMISSPIFLFLFCIAFFLLPNSFSAVSYLDTVFLLLILILSILLCVHFSCCYRTFSKVGPVIATIISLIIFYFNSMQSAKTCQDAFTIKTFEITHFFVFK